MDHPGMIEIIGLIADISDAFVVLLLTFGMLFAVSRAVPSLFWRRKGQDRLSVRRAILQIRYDLGILLLLALEILIISDILHTIYKRTFEEISILAVTVAVRIALSFFLDRELTRLREDGEVD